MQLKQILIPLDGSPIAEMILPFIVAIAPRLDMEVVILRVVPSAQPTAVESSRPLICDDEARRIDADAYLARLAVELRDKGIRVQTRVCRGSPAAEIVTAAREVGADLIAMSTHGRGGFRYMMCGSVAEAVLRDSNVPVFLFRATEGQVAHRGPGQTAS
jgi:nucleotide-binding universal stress UspA family protein